MQTPVTLLDDDSGLVKLYPEWLRNSEAFYQYCRQNLDWQSRTIRLFGKAHVIPRLECWLGDPGLRYGYSGQEYVASGWPEGFKSLLDRFQSQHDFAPNGALMNYYRSGADTMGWHADDEPELGLNPTIAILSLGGARDFHFRQHKDHSQKLKLRLPEGSLLLMSGAVQHHWQHALPKRAQARPRISCTFRRIVA
ncbi:alpha-ketoglutarate-dependent dioxygenase AlkB family protein [Reinekea blandensis]|uniref:Fe2OG dioxygenase domain-containing protein n=1 Tax=Reinekea blandensis MED297 TaxID=314283 RepID=A4BAI0_9GAMM|nr:alpha-ketoglutarate-dependent dioxygenase AlkB [Reinekea blandensis]EAR10936.1 hypothetical protein MED297_10511 [Reinekea sp. MED297] [Reinekea blandensis MED297]